MIDELVKVAEAMDGAGIVPENWHPRLKVLPKVTKKAPCLRIWLTKDGHVKDVELLEEKQVLPLRKFEPNNGTSLPGFNVRPLYRLVKSKDECRKIPREIEAALENGEFDWSPFMEKENDFWNKTRDGLIRCFGTVRESLEKLCSDNLEDNETLQLFFDAIRQIDVVQFQEEYRGIVRDKIETGELPLSLMCYFVTAEKKLKEDANSRVPVPKFSVFLDITEYEDYPVAHEATMKRLNTLLLNIDGATYKRTVSIGNERRDAYGKDAILVTEKFPSVALPFLGGVILRSQAKTIPAQNRYHQCESNTFPVGAQTRKRTKAALEWIVNKERDGVTYGFAGDKELLFAYPTVLPKDKIPLVAMFGAQPDEGLTGKKFENLAKNVIHQLKGLGQQVNEAELEIFSLKKMDKARTKVVYYRNLSVVSLEIASNAWHKGCQNIPRLEIKQWSEKKLEGTDKAHPILTPKETVFPIKLHRYMNTVWKRNGDQAGIVKIFTPSDGLRLLLEKHNQALSSAYYMMERFIQHSQGYFHLLCKCTGRNEIASLPDKKYYPGILGLLLLKSGKQKEVFMKESAFLLGRFLRVADEIHRLYCEVVRKNDLPPELCGSSMLLGMMEAPSMTLSQLATRSAPYVKWARGGSDKEDKGGLVWYWLRQWEDISDELHKLEWPRRLKPDERAQLFLGYLSSFPKKVKPANAKINGENTNNQGE